MSFIEYLEEKIWFILFIIMFLFVLSIFLFLAELSLKMTLLLDGFLIMMGLAFIIVDFVIKKKEQQNIINLVDSLEEKYLISEMLTKPRNLINNGYYYTLKKACKAMNDKISQIENDRKDYQEYIESFAHEIKTPISVLSLYADNKKDKILSYEVGKINNLVEQVLFYARSTNTEKDYFVKEIKLADLLHPVLLDYKDYLLTKKITLDVHNLDLVIWTDEKWLKFIVAQIIQNAIKYTNKKDNEIQIYGIEDKHNITLIIKDNGRGISQADLLRVFDKGFTGSNRHNKQATGMGLYLSKKLCDRLNLGLEINSQKNNYTEVIIIFPKTDLHKFN